MSVRIGRLGEFTIMNKVSWSLIDISNHLPGHRPGHLPNHFPNHPPSSYSD